MVNVVSRRFVFKLRKRLLDSSGEVKGMQVWSKVLGLGLMVGLYAGFVGVVSYVVLAQDSMMVALVGF